jgi:CRISPR-associated protein Csb1
VFERRRIDGAEVWCVLVDSVQSQANRLEEALLAAVRERAIALPYVTVDFAGKEWRESAKSPHSMRRTGL